MTRAEKVLEIQQLPFRDQVQIHETLTRLLANQRQAPTRNDLAIAARALLADYQNDPELTAFTSLDGDDFHAAR